MNTITIALDWTPNTLHSGIYLAQLKNYAKQENIDFQISHAGQDLYIKTPARKLFDGEVNVAIMPSESILSYNLKHPENQLIAIAAITHQDTSAIVTLADSGIDSPKQLDGKIYASYQALFEDEIVKEMIKNNGGEGKLNIQYPEKLGIWNTLIDKKADATWVFMPWEGVEAELKGIQLNAFKLEDYEITYGYSPLIVVRKKFLNEHASTIKSFLKAIGKGYVFAHNNKINSAKMLFNETEMANYASEEMIFKSLLAFKNSFLNENFTWGVMDRNRWIDFLSFLYTSEIINKKFPNVDFSALQPEDFFTNDFITRNLMV
jgi:NitT/TauT family transport system substrate-binding protein